MENDSLLMDHFYLSPSLDFAQPGDEGVPDRRGVAGPPCLSFDRLLSHPWGTGLQRGISRRNGTDSESRTVPSLPGTHLPPSE